MGLPTEDDMGNSEVGHNALGAGRIYAQGLVSLSISISSVMFFHILSALYTHDVSSFFLKILRYYN